MPKVRMLCTMARVVGYYRPKSRWNAGKKQEFADRKFASFKDHKL